MVQTIFQKTFNTVATARCVRWNQIIMMMKEEKGERTDILVFLKEMDDIYNGMRNQKVSPFEKELKRRKKLRLAE